MVPAIRVRARNDRPVRSPAQGGRYVLYWMVAARRTTWNFALDHALDHCARLQLPLVIFEPLRIGYRWASDRHHAFVLQGMADNAAAVADAAARTGAAVTYLPWVEPDAGAGRGLLEALGADAAVVVTDDWPSFFVPAMVTAAADKLGARGVRLEDVDGNGLLPVRAAGDQVFPTAYAFRRFLQKELPAHLLERPQPAPLASLSSSTTPWHRAVDLSAVQARWPSASLDPAHLSALPIDHAVPVVAARGGAAAGAARLDDFVARKLARYGEDRSSPDRDGQSGLSPWIHWGHVGVHAVVDAVWRSEGWTPDRAGRVKNGSREGFWGLSATAEGFLDELVTWRELGFNMTSRRPDADRWESLPTWAQETLLSHAADPRKYQYTYEQLEDAQTHDPLWNAAQRQLRVEGVVHNYLRMLWGKKVLEWSADPRDALRHLIELNNRWATDGRDPNSLSGIFWVFGRYDRPWGPVRPIFGTIRYMTSENTQKKHDCDAYLRRWGGGPRPARASATRSTASAAQGRLL
jgi:deoxyribodipyrimidine photo-lyase